MRTSINREAPVGYWWNFTITITVMEVEEEAGRDGVEVEDILIFIMILSYKANTPVSLTGERGYPNPHSPDHDAS